MVTQQQLLTVSRNLPAQFSIGELVDLLINSEQGGKEPQSIARATPKQTEQANPADIQVVASPKPALSPAVAALRGIAKLQPEDEHKSYDELRWEAMRDKYNL